MNLVKFKNSLAKLFSQGNYLMGFGLLMCILFTVSSCKTTKPGADLPSGEMEAAKIIDEVRALEFSAHSIDSRAKMEVGFDGQSYSFRSQIRSIVDSAIWIRATILGFEVGRVLITPDTFQLIDRVNREYVKMSLNEVGSRYGLEMNFSQLQQMLLGSPSFDDIVVRDLKIGNPQATIFGFFKTFQVIYQINENRLVDKYSLIDPSGRLLEANNNNYMEVDEVGFFAFERTIRGVDESDEFILYCEFLELEVNSNPPLPFSIPNRYDRVE
nr:DUF4292 domain-containing protein [Saprospiraceae bacterium]